MSASHQAAAPAVQWSAIRWDALSRDDLYDALQLRCRVFILEQGPYLDPDGWDRLAWHLLGRDAASGQLLACLRLLDPGVRFDEPSIGRVVTAPEARGRGLGRALMEEGLRLHTTHWPRQANRISAQAHLQGFYQSLGYRTVGAPYGEDNIPHVQMLRDAPERRASSAP
jgi:ElaA protein